MIFGAFYFGEYGSGVVNAVFTPLPLQLWLGNVPTQSALTTDDAESNLTVQAALE